MAQHQTNDEPTIHVVLRKEDLDPGRITDKTVVVVDVLFATTSIIAALDHGVTVVYPARDADEARKLSERAGTNDPVLAGESMFRLIDGFAPPTPLALRPHLDGRDALVYTTTNGTVALRACAGARRVLAAALINTGATVDAIGAARHGTIVILCAGTAGAFNLEDFYGAGCLVHRIIRQYSGYTPTDSAIAAMDCFRSSDAEVTLRKSLMGRLLLQSRLDREITFAARIDSSRLVAELHEDRVEAVAV